MVSLFQSRNKYFCLPQNITQSLCRQLFPKLGNKFITGGEYDAKNSIGGL